MKRKFVSLNLLLVICLLLLLQACSMFPMAVTNNMENFSFQLNSPMNAWAVQELDNGYYIWENNTLSFIDLASLTLTPVCGKPDCLHGEEADLAKREACEAKLCYSKTETMTFLVYLVISCILLQRTVGKIME